MNKMIVIGVGVGVIVSVIIYGNYLVQNQTTEFIGISSKPIPPVTQQDLRVMIDEWMNSKDRNDINQRLEIMKAWYTFEESDQKLTDDQEGRIMLNQIRKMISFDIPKTDLDQIKENIGEELRGFGFKTDFEQH
ncbi:MAG: proteinase inhibitor [Nitrosopumilus sp.]|nr:proteinase inhibitor [Nitrosopumilus sp.]MDH5658086.1 proteinase inhibitor [Nitrosopumilus sp.]